MEKNKKEFKEKLEKFIEEIEPYGEKEWNLSEKRINPYSEGDYKAYLLVTDVKEFIRRLKEWPTINPKRFHLFVDKLAGEELK